MEVIFIGNDAFNKTGGKMGSLYIKEEGTGEPIYTRTGWGNVERKIMAGEQFVVRAPNQDELILFSNTMMGHISSAPAIYADDPGAA